MITCPWCGTNYQTFQSDCPKCGGPMSIPAGEAATTAGDAASTASDVPPVPPPAPRPIAGRYAWQLLLTDGWAVVAFVFGLLGIIFLPVGLGLTLGIITAIVGIPFLLLGLAFLGAGVGVGIWRYQEAQKVIGVLRIGEAAEGQIAGVDEILNVEINGRHPWQIRYQFVVAGQTYDGEVKTINPLGQALRPGKRACVLYLPGSPERNVLYPHP
jgi:hypothetical protein